MVAVAADLILAVVLLALDDDAPRVVEARVLHEVGEEDRRAGH